MSPSICVCGAGTMGRGIAQVAIQAGCTTILFDPISEALNNAQKSMEKNLQGQVEKGRLSAEEQLLALSRLRYVHHLHECKADIIIEAIIEQMEPKVSLFKQLASWNSDDAIFASNTSSLSVTSLAECVPGPQRLVGMHFFNPAPVMKLVEIVHTKYTLPKVMDTIIALARTMGKTPVLCKDSPGFIVNHVARPYYLEALRLYEQGFADLETIDLLMESSGFRMGPFRLMDLIGNDINYAVSCSVFEGLNRPIRLLPSAIQEQKVKEGALGKKSGRGYYIYS